MRPTREECTVNRVNSNTPLQALDLLNDPIYVEAARVFAQNILEQGWTRSRPADSTGRFCGRSNREPSSGRAQHPERACIARTWRASRRRPAMRDGVVGGGRSAARPEDANQAELAAMTTVARAILNLHETITRN